MKAAAQVQEAQRKLAAAQQRQRAWEAGADGEERTADALAVLEPDGWRILHDLHWPGRPFANIDHIAIGPGGVFVIDSKNWSGRVTVRDGDLRQNGYRRSEVCEAVASATAAVAAFLEPQHRSSVTAMVALVDQPTPEDQPAKVEIRGLGDLAAHLRGRAPRLTTQEVTLIEDYLRRILGGQRSPAQTTTAALSNAKAGPREPARPSPARPRHSRGRAQVRRSAPTRPRRSPRRKTTGGQEALLTLLKLAGIAFLLLVLLPAWLHSLDRRETGVPSTPTPAATRIDTPQTR